MTGIGASLAPSRVATRVPLVASFAALASGLVWSLGALAARLASHTDAWQYLIWRSLGVIVVIETITRFRRRPALLPQAYRSGRSMLVADAGLLLASVAYVYAIKNTTAANASFLASITPLVAVVLARIVLHERLTTVTVVALVVALAGLLITVSSDLGAGNMKGNLAAALSSVGFAIYTVAIRSNPRRDWSPVLPGYAAAMVVLCTVVTLANGRPLVPPAADVAFAVVHGGMFIVGGTVLFNLGSRSVPAVAMTVFAQTETVFVPLWIFLRFGERPAVVSLIGGAIILLAVLGKAVLDARPGSREPRHAAEPNPGSIA